MFRPVKKVSLTYLLILFLLVSCGTGGNKDLSGGNSWSLSTVDGKPAVTVAVDTMDIRNPFILFEHKSNMYYMVGDGGGMWMSKDLHTWNGPFNVLQQDTASWIGPAPEITSPEIHRYGNRYYYMATFERNDVHVNGYDGKPFKRRSCTVLVADSIKGPYRTIDRNSDLLDIHEMAAHPTFCTDDLDVGYMIYNNMAEQNGNGTVQIVRFTENLGRRMGEAYVMFTASQNPWSGKSSGDNKGFSPDMEAPFLFVTEGGELGILFTTFIGEEKAIGVAYSEKGHGLNGPWKIEPEPLMKDGIGGAMMFNDYDGTLVMVAGKDTVIDGTEKCVPKLMKMDSQFDKLQLKGYYKF